MNFGQAIEALKEGKKLQRTGWNGKDMFLYLVPENSYKTQTEVARQEFGEMAPYGAYIAIKTVQNTVEAGWRPTSMDMLTDDWLVVA